MPCDVLHRPFWFVLRAHIIAAECHDSFKTEVDHRVYSESTVIATQPLEPNYENYCRPKVHFWAGIAHVWSTTSPNLALKFVLAASCAIQNSVLAASRIQGARLHWINGVGNACPVRAIWKQFCGGTAYGVTGTSGCDQSKAANERSAVPPWTKTNFETSNVRLLLLTSTNWASS